MSLNYVNLTVDLRDGSGNLINGGVAVFTPSATLDDPVDHQYVPQASIIAAFYASGSPIVSLLATDNANVTPSGWAWTVSFQNVPGNPAPFNFFLPFSSGASQFLSTQAPVSSVVSMQAYMPLPAGTAAAGQVPIATGVGSASAWGNVATNPLIGVGDMPYGGNSGALTRLPADTSNIRKFLREQSSGGVGQAPAWDTIQAGDVPTLNQSTTGTAANVTGTVAIANGGTGQDTQQAALDALAGAQAANQVLAGNGTHVTLRALAAADLPAATTSAQGAVQVATTIPAATSSTGATGSAATMPRSDHVHAQDYLGMFGDGSDGSVTLDGSTTFNNFSSLAGSTYTLTRDVFATNLTINNTVTLKTAGFRIFCQGTFTDNNGSIVSAIGNNGTAAGVAGSSTPQGSLSNGKAGGAGATGVGSAGSSNNGAGTNTGGAGGTGSSGAGGAGGTSGSTATFYYKIPTPVLSGFFFVNGTSTSVTGGPGGGGGGGDATNKGGGGGGGGGVITINAWAIVHNGTYTVAGGNGGTPTTGNCGGGGAGSGGLILTYSLSAPTGSGTNNVSAGTVGSGIGTGTAGGTGSSGSVVNQVVS